jgi:dihydroneopterin aldolase
MYDEEKNTGNNFEVNLSVELDMLPESDHISATVDYISIYDLVRKEMEMRRGLLETLADSIVSNILKMSPVVSVVTIEIWKLNPSVEQFEGKVGITLSRSKNSK